MSTDFNIRNIIGDFLGGLGGAYVLKRGGRDLMDKSKLALTFAVAHFISLKVITKATPSSIWMMGLFDVGATTGLLYAFDSWYYGGADVQDTVTYSLTSILLGDFAKGFVPGATQVYIPIMSA